jgi:hypothetical protein
MDGGQLQCPRHVRARGNQPQRAAQPVHDTAGAHQLIGHRWVHPRQVGKVDEQVPGRLVRLGAERFTQWPPGLVGGLAVQDDQRVRVALVLPAFDRYGQPGSPCRLR